jgi:ketosteroid isomerase-like protein
MDRIDDRAAIHDLNSLYAISFDEFRLAECVNCWTHDGVLDESETGFGVFHGREEIRKFFRDSLFANAQHVVHLMFNHLVTDIDGDTATGRVSCLTEIVRNDGAHLRAYVTYTDDYRRTDGEWKFGSRTITSAFPHEALNT